MYVDQLDVDASTLVTRDDPRVTPVGRFIRKASIDKLPQLVNVVFKGDLSLVGPRPHAVHAKAANRQYDEVVDGYFARHRVKPGITGWAQINGWRGETDTQEKIQQRVEHDLYYIENWSILFDMQILRHPDFAGQSEERVLIAMTATLTADAGPRAQTERRAALDVETIRRVILWVFIASGASAVIEPSPFEFMFALAAIAFAGAGGLRFDRAFAPMIVCLTLYEAGGLIALPPFAGERERHLRHRLDLYRGSDDLLRRTRGGRSAEAHAHDPLRLRRGRALRRLRLGILGYFDVAGLGPLFTLYDNARATGPFKDPNVFVPLRPADRLARAGPAAEARRLIVVERGDRRDVAGGAAQFLARRLGRLCRFAGDHGRAHRRDDSLGARSCARRCRAGCAAAPSAG